MKTTGFLVGLASGLQHSRLTTLGKSDGASFPSTTPQSMVLSLLNDAPWSYKLAHAEVTEGVWLVPPRATIAPKGTKAAGNWAMRVGADANGGAISATLQYNASDSGVGNLDRDFSVKIMASGSQFGIFFSHSKATDPTIEPPVYMGNDTVFTSLDALTINARRPLSASCRGAATALCGGTASSRFACENCVAHHSNELQDAGCDTAAQKTDLATLACSLPPAAECLAAVAAACPSASAADWLACANCLDEQHSTFAANCTGTGGEVEILYAHCVDGK